MNLFSKTLFLCQILEDRVKVLKCLNAKGTKEFVDFETDLIPPGSDDKTIIEKLGSCLKKLGYHHEPILAVLPRNLATCRYQKIPAQSQAETEKIVSLQASRFLPYSNDELISGYEILTADQEGYSYVNITVVHRTPIERYLVLFNTFHPKAIIISLSSYGLCSLYNSLHPQDQGPLCIIDIEMKNIELAITYEKKLYFSRFIKLDPNQNDWQDLFINELQKTFEAYRRQINLPLPQKIILLGFDAYPQEIIEGLNQKSSYRFETRAYGLEIKAKKTLQQKIKDSGLSLGCLIGSALVEPAPNLCFLPRQHKARMKETHRYQQGLKTFLTACAGFLILGLAVLINLDNKERYLKYLELTLAKLNDQAAPLERIEKQLKIYSSKKEQKSRLLEILSDLPRILPNEIILSSFRYEEKKDILLQGQAQDFDDILGLMKSFESSDSFRSYLVKVRFATKKKTSQGEVISFEILGERK